MYCLLKKVIILKPIVKLDFDEAILKYYVYY